MLYQSLKLTNGIWVLAELRIQPGNPSFTVRRPLPPKAPGHSKFCLGEFTGHSRSGINFHNYLFNFLIIKGIIPGWQEANLLTPTGQCSTQTPTWACDSFVSFQIP